MGMNENEAQGLLLRTRGAKWPQDNPSRYHGRRGPPQAPLSPKWSPSPRQSHLFWPRPCFSVSMLVNTNWGYRGSPCLGVWGGYFQQECPTGDKQQTPG